MTHEERGRKLLEEFLADYDRNDFRSVLIVAMFDFISASDPYRGKRICEYLSHNSQSKQ